MWMSGIDAFVWYSAAILSNCSMLVFTMNTPKAQRV